MRALRRGAIRERLHAPNRHLFERRCRSLWEAGPRVVGALLDELAVRHGLGAEVDELLAGYAAIDAGVVRRLGADRFAERGPRLVPAVAA
jgi:hypothetical protein